jgi:Protein of unknown function (DUF4232)
MRTVAIVGIGALAVGVLAGCGGSARPAASASAAATPPAALTSCRAASLTWRPGGLVVPMTGEHAEMFELVNRGPAACTVRGYPGAVLYGASGAALPFRYADGGGMYVTRKKPVAVTLKPGAAAYLVIAKYRCDLGIEADAASVKLTLHVAGGVIGRRLRLPVTGAPGLSYCTGGRHDPGQLVTISPVESNSGATRPAPAG